MKNIIQTSALVASLLFMNSVVACDMTKGISGLTGAQILITLQPGVPHVEIWDLSDCTGGITSDSFFITKPRSNNGSLNRLPPGTPLIVTLHDLTTDTYYPWGPFDFPCINDCNSVCGHILEMTLTLSASSHKPLNIEITQTANWGGSCQ